MLILGTATLYSFFVIILPIQSFKYFGERMSGFNPMSLSMGILQLSVSSDKNANILLASQEIDTAAKASAELLVEKNFNFDFANVFKIFGLTTRFFQNVGTLRTQ